MASVSESSWNNKFINTCTNCEDSCFYGNGNNLMSLFIEGGCPVDCTELNNCNLNSCAQSSKNTCNDNLECYWDENQNSGSGLCLEVQIKDQCFKAETSKECLLSGGGNNN
jgi:hypothetical protein